MIKSTKELEAELEREKDELITHASCDQDYEDAIIRIHHLEGKIADRKKTHFDEMVAMLKELGKWNALYAHTRLHKLLVKLEGEK